MGDCTSPGNRDISTSTLTLGSESMTLLGTWKCKWSHMGGSTSVKIY